MQINKIKNLGYINFSLLIIVFLLVFFKLFSFSFFQYNVFTDRDLIRASDLLNNFQLYGAELNYLEGLRIYGGFYYYYLSILTSITSNVNFIFLYFEIAIIISLLFFIYILKDFGLRSGLISIIFFYTSFNYIPESSILWNPNMGFHLCILSYAFFFKYLIDKNYLYLFVGFLFSFLAAQFHLSFLIPIFCFYLISIFKDYKSIKNFVFVNLIISLSILISYFPFLLNYLYSFQYENLIEIERDINNQLEINIVDYLRTKIAKIFYLQSFSEISLITNYKIPFMAFIIIGISLFVIQIKQHLFISLYGQNFYSNYKFLILILVLTLLLTSFIFSVFSNYNNINTIGFFQKAELRYLTFIVPILSILCGFAITLIIDFLLDKSKISSYVIILFFILIISSRFLFILSENYKELRGSPDNVKFYQSYSMANDLIDIAINKYALNKNDVLRNFSITTVNKNQLKSTLINYQYIVETKTNLNFKENNHCLLSIVDTKFIEKSEVIRMFNDFGIKSYQIQKVGNHNFYNNKKFKATFVKFETNNSACPSSMYNSYILTNKEKQTDHYLKDKQDNTSFLEKNSNNSFEVLFKITIPTSNYPLNVSLDFRFNQTYFEIFTNAKRLRNLTQLDGYWEKVLVLNPKLEFINLKNNKKYHYNIHDGLLGSPLYNTPWFNKFSKPPKGLYKINFKADEIFEGKNVNLKKTKLDRLKIKDYSIQIIENFEIN